MHQVVILDCPKCSKKNIAISAFSRHWTEHLNTKTAQIFDIITITNENQQPAYEVPDLDFDIPNPDICDITDENLKMSGFDEIYSIIGNF